MIFGIRLYLILTQVELSPTLKKYFEELGIKNTNLMSNEPFLFVSSVKNSRLECKEKENLIMKVILLII